MSVGVRDKMMSDIATVAATEYCREIEATGGADQTRIKQNHTQYLNHTIPYLTVRTLHKLQADSRWIKAFAIITGILTAALVALTIVLAIYAWRLDETVKSLQKILPTASPVTH